MLVVESVSYPVDRCHHPVYEIGAPFVEFLDPNRLLVPALSLDRLLEVGVVVGNVLGQTKVGDTCKSLDHEVVCLEELFYTADFVVLEELGAELQPFFLLSDPGPFALLHDNIEGQLVEDSPVQRLEVDLIIRQGPVGVQSSKSIIPISVGILLQVLNSKIGLYERSVTWLALRELTRRLQTWDSYVLGGSDWLTTCSGYYPASQSSMYTLCMLWFMVLCLWGSMQALNKQNPATLFWKRVLLARGRTCLNISLYNITISTSTHTLIQECCVQGPKDGILYIDLMYLTKQGNFDFLGQMYKHRVASSQEIESFFEKAYGHRQKRIYAYYTSNFDKIIMQESRMLMPIDDRVAIRGQGAFDTIYLKKLRLINLREHVDRLLKSAEAISIVSPLSVQAIQKNVMETVGATLEGLVKQGNSKKDLQGKVLIVRIQLSGGYGDFGIASLGKQSIFSVIVSDPFIDYESEKLGVKQFVVLQADPKQMVHAKTANYVENTMMANMSNSKGGYLGVKMTKDHIILEASVANIAFVFGKQFASPRLETVIIGTTITKCRTRLQELVGQGTLSAINFRDISQEQAYKADQILIIGGDKIVPVLELDGHPISANRGRIALALQQWYQSTLQQGVQIEFSLQS